MLQSASSGHKSDVYLGKFAYKTRASGLLCIKACPQKHRPTRKGDWRKVTTALGVEALETQRKSFAAFVRTLELFKELACLFVGFGVNEASASSEGLSHAGEAAHKRIGAARHFELERQPRRLTRFGAQRNGEESRSECLQG